MARRSGDSEDLIANIILYGIVGTAIIAGLLLCWWSEDQTSRYYRLGAQASQVAAEMEDIDKIDPALEGKLVHATGQAKSPEELKDPLFGISLKAFTFNREVSYYQLVENKHKHKDKDKDNKRRYEVTYSYYERWVNTPVSSAGFYESRQRNRGVYPLTTLKNLHLVAQEVTFGAYRIPEEFVKSAGESQAISPELTTQKRQELAKELGIREDQLHNIPKGLYIGEDPNNPHLGDVRILLSYVPTEEVSILAKVKGDTFERFHDPKDPDNVNFGEIRTGTVSLEEMFKEVKSNVTWGAWLMRAFSFILIAAGSFFLPWDDMVKEWEFFDPLKFALFLFLTTVGGTWLANGSTTTGIVLIAIAAVSFPWSCLLAKSKPKRR